jgi:hypothetical protein
VNRLITSTFIAASCLVALPHPFAETHVMARAPQERDAQAAGAQAVTPPASDATKLVYADFEKVENGKPVSARGGSINIYAYEEQGTQKATFSGPELVHVKKDDPNHALKFDFALFAPTNYTGVTLEIHGQPDAEGKLVPDDVSEYKYLTLDCYAKGIEIIRLEVISKGRGKDMAFGYPQYAFKVQPGLTTYRTPLNKFTQPEWIKDERVDPKDILRFLTSVNVGAFCDQCVLPKQGMVILDNIAFEK